MQLKETQFLNCSLKDVDFVEANLLGSSFNQSNLEGAMFEQSNLQNADFSTALNFSIDPDINQLKGAKFGRDGLEGLLKKYQIKIV